MAVSGNFDLSQLKELQAKLNRLQEADKFIGECAEELAVRLLEKVMERMPVGQYPEESGKSGGKLRRGWDISEVKQRGDVYYIEIFNPVEYASYVEYGHSQQPGRYVSDIGKKLKNRWVPGKFMLKISADEVQSLSRPLLEEKIKKYLSEVFL